MFQKIKNFISSYTLKHPKLLSFIMALLSIFSLPCAINTGDKKVVAGSFMLFVILMGFYFVNLKAIKEMTTRLFCFSFFLGFIYSLFLITGRNMEIYNTIEPSDSLFHALISLLFVSLLLNLTMSSFIAILLKGTNQLFNYLINLEIPDKLKTLMQPNKKCFFLTWFIILLSWTFLFVIFYPGFYHFDVSFQLMEFLNNSVSLKHPFLHGIWVYKTMELGHALGSDTLGAGLYTFSQMFILSGLFAYACNIISKLNASYTLRLIAILFFAFHPINQLYALASTKDVIFAGIMLIVCLKLAEIVINTDEFFNSRKKQISFIVTLVFLFLFRNNAIHSFILFIPFFLLLYKKEWKKILFICLTPIIVYLLTVSAVADYFDLRKGNMADMLSTPLMQTAWVLKYEDVDKSYEDTFYEVVKQGSLNWFLTRSVDNLKADYVDWHLYTFNDEKLMSNPQKYLKLWLDLGLKYPKDYLDAFAALNLAYFYPDYNYDMLQHGSNKFIGIGCWGRDKLDNIYETPYFIRTKLYPVYGDYKLSLFIHYMIEPFFDGMDFRKVPILSFFLTIASSLWILLFASAFLCFIKKYKSMLVLLFPWCYYFGLMFGPVSIWRYVYCIFLCLIPVAFLIEAQGKDFRELE